MEASESTRQGTHVMEATTHYNDQVDQDPNDRQDGKCSLVEVNALEFLGYENSGESDGQNLNSLKLGFTKFTALLKEKGKFEQKCHRNIKMKNNYLSPPATDDEMIFSQSSPPIEPTSTSFDTDNNLLGSKRRRTMDSGCLTTPEPLTPDENSDDGYQDSLSDYENTLTQSSLCDKSERLSINDIINNATKTEPNDANLMSVVTNSVEDEKDFHLKCADQITALSSNGSKKFGTDVLNESPLHCDIMSNGKVTDKSQSPGSLMWADSTIIQEARTLSLSQNEKVEPLCVSSDAPLTESFPSQKNGVELVILLQPESQHRPRYKTEGSRGAIKDQSQNGHPKVSVIGYSKPVILQVFVSCDTGKIRPHEFYQAYPVTGRNCTSAKDRKINGTTVIEIKLDPANNMTACIDCVGILKLRNIDVEHKTGFAPSKKKSTKVRMVFRVAIPQEKAPFTLQIASNPIICAQPTGQPELCRKSLDESLMMGGEDLFIIGKNMTKDAKVEFREMDGDRIIWQAWADVDTEYLQQTHLICKIPKYGNANYQSSREVQIVIHCGERYSEPETFTYRPLEVECKGEKQELPAGTATININDTSNSKSPPACISPEAIKMNQCYEDANRGKSRCIILPDPFPGLVKSGSSTVSPNGMATLSSSKVPVLVTVPGSVPPSSATTLLATVLTTVPSSTSELIATSFQMKPFSTVASPVPSVNSAVPMDVDVKYQIKASSASSLSAGFASKHSGIYSNVSFSNTTNHPVTSATGNPAVLFTLSHSSIAGRSGTLPNCETVSIEVPKPIVTTAQKAAPSFDVSSKENLDCVEQKSNQSKSVTAERVLDDSSSIPVPISNLSINQIKANHQQRMEKLTSSDSISRNSINVTDCLGELLKESISENHFSSANDNHNFESELLVGHVDTMEGISNMKCKYENLSQDNVDEPMADIQERRNLENKHISMDKASFSVSSEENMFCFDEENSGLDEEYARKNGNGENVLQDILEQEQSFQKGNIFTSVSKEHRSELKEDLLNAALEISIATPPCDGQDQSVLIDKSSCLMNDADPSFSIVDDDDISQISNHQPDGFGGENHISEELSKPFIENCNLLSAERPANENSVEKCTYEEPAFDQDANVNEMLTDQEYPNSCSVQREYLLEEGSSDVASGCVTNCSLFSPKSHADEQFRYHHTEITDDWPSTGEYIEDSKNMSTSEMNDGDTEKSKNYLMDNTSADHHQPLSETLIFSSGNSPRFFVTPTKVDGRQPVVSSSISSVSTSSSLELGPVSSDNCCHTMQQPLFVISASTEGQLLQNSPYIFVPNSTVDGEGTNSDQPTIDTDKPEKTDELPKLSPTEVDSYLASPSTWNQC